MDKESIYETAIRNEIVQWRHAILKQPGKLKQTTHAFQSISQDLMPQNVQDFLTQSIKTMTQTIMAASRVTTDSRVYTDIRLSESDYLIEKKFQTYDKIAIAQGVTFGLGGLLMGLGDFPALLSIKVKFLFECAKLYGYDVNDPRERLFILYIFQLAFCNDARRADVFKTIKEWDDHRPESVDWEKLQMEYRDTIDIAKMLQLLPVVGSIFGGTANHRLLRHLKVTAMNSYRLRVIRNRNKSKI